MTKRAMWVAGMRPHAGGPMRLQNTLSRPHQAWTAFCQSPRAAMLARAFWVALVPGAALFAWIQFQGYRGLGMIGVDSHAYWLAAREPASWYTRPVATWDAYLYSPAFAQVIWPVAQLPWRAFQTLWFVAQLGSAWWLLRPMGWRKAAVLIPFLTGELLLGNLYVFFALVLVLAVRAGAGPTALVLPLLTKVTPAVAGLWYVLRGEWRAVAKVAVAAGVVVAASALLDAGAWVRWVHFVAQSSDSDRGQATLFRLVLSIALVVVAARTDRSVLLAPALILACPVLGGWNYMAVLLALPRLVIRDRRARQSSTSGSEQEDETVVAPAHGPTAVAL